MAIGVDTLRRTDRIKGDPIDTERLHEVRARLIAAFEASNDGRLTRAALVDAGLTADAAEQAIGLEYATKIEPKIDDGMPLSERLEELRAADANADLGRRVMLWREVIALMRGQHETSARAEIVSLQEQEGAIPRCAAQRLPHDQSRLASPHDHH